MLNNDRFLPQVVLNNFVKSTTSHSIFNLTCKTTRLFIKNCCQCVGGNGKPECLSAQF